MALIACQDCGKAFSDSSRACPFCGWRRPSGALKWLLVPLALGALFLMWGASISSTPEGQARASERAAIDLCWQDQRRKSLDAGTAQFVAGACEMMEDRFRQKWGRNP